MLSLKEFKEYKIDENPDVLSMIKGGIHCAMVLRVLDYLWDNNRAQYYYLMETFPDGIPCDC